MLFTLCYWEQPLPNWIAFKNSPRKTDKLFIQSQRLFSQTANDYFRASSVSTLRNYAIFCWTEIPTRLVTYRKHCSGNLLHSEKSWANLWGWEMREIIGTTGSPCAKNASGTALGNGLTQALSSGMFFCSPRSHPWADKASLLTLSATALRYGELICHKSGGRWMWICWRTGSWIWGRIWQIHDTGTSHACMHKDLKKRGNPKLLSSQNSLLRRFKPYRIWFLWKPLWILMSLPLSHYISWICFLHCKKTQSNWKVLYSIWVSYQKKHIWINHQHFDEITLHYDVISYFSITALPQVFYSVHDVNLYDFSCKLALLSDLNDFWKLNESDPSERRI